MDFGSSDRWLFWAAAAIVLFIGLGLVGILQRSIQAEFKGQKVSRSKRLQARIVRDCILIGATGLALFLTVVPLLGSQTEKPEIIPVPTELTRKVAAHERRLTALAREQAQLAEQIGDATCEGCGRQTGGVPTSFSSDVRGGVGVLLLLAGIAMLAAGISLIWSGVLLIRDSRGAKR